MSQTRMQMEGSILEKYDDASDYIYVRQSKAVWNKQCYSPQN